MIEINGFEWDRNKAEINELKHNVSFNEAITVFYDDDALLIPDPEHSFFEERFLLLGLSLHNNTLVVVHCERDENIRIISARHATKKEKEQYQRGF
ncbi:BrnT family toxin [Lonepinella sp. BR2919]|uniref:BrnT family toxin n=1 Tax=unclassified Lonepinella TaxID=2642006 RepID=UPI003F6DB459